MTRTVDIENAERISMRVVDALADDADADPLAMEPPLYDAIDPEALDRLFERAPPARIEFEYDGRNVTILGDGTISIDDSR